nr:hypothetical protein Iba_scaffold182CG0010 [Ipomoea batatas]
MIGKRARSDRSWSGQAWPDPKKIKRIGSEKNSIAYNYRGTTWDAGVTVIALEDPLTVTVVVSVTLALPGQACGGRRILHSSDVMVRRMREETVVEALTVPVAVVLAFNTRPFSHSNVTVTFGAAGVPVLPQTRAPFKFTVEFNELAADGAVNATVATHKNIQNAAYQEEPIVYYYI